MTVATYNRRSISACQKMIRKKGSWFRRMAQPFPSGTRRLRYDSSGWGEFDEELSPTGPSGNDSRRTLSLG